MAAAPELSARELPRLLIRPMHEGDVPLVAAIEQASYQFPWSENIFRDCVRVGYVCRAAELGTRVIGYAIMSAGAGEAHILNVCVDPAYRCRGLGRAVLEHLFEYARRAGLHDVFLEVRPSNTVAIRLYQSLGFEQIGVRRGYYQAVDGREDATVLRLELIAPR
jgi:ribosomal-protein-alanine N-acetyltransferase